MKEMLKVLGVVKYSPSTNIVARIVAIFSFLYSLSKSLALPV